MIGRVALLITFKKAKPKSQSLSRSHIRDLCGIVNRSIALVEEVQMLSTRFDNLN